MSGAPDTTPPAPPLAAWTVLSSRELFDASPWLSVQAETVRLPDGRTVEDYYQVRQLDFALMFVEDADGRVLTLRSYKHGPRRVSLTFPAGAVEPGEDPLAGAKRELLEETGYEAAEWTALGSFVVQSNQRGCACHIFHATGARKVAEPDDGDLEEMRLEHRTRAELFQAAARGDFAVLPVLALLGAVLVPELRAGLAAAAAGSTG